MNGIDRSWVEEQNWYHSIDLGGGVVTPIRVAGAPPNYALFGFFDLVNDLVLDRAHCVDVGTMDGLAAFVMKKLGAEHVLAVDMSPLKTVELVRDALSLDVDYRTPVAALDLPEILGPRSVDLILMAGVLYHVYDPLTVLAACRKTLRRDGYLILETAYIFDEARAQLSFNPLISGRRQIGQPHLFWRPSLSAVEGMLQLTGFEVVRTIAVNARLTVLARARRPSAIPHRPPLVQETHEFPRAHYAECLDFTELEDDDSEPARISYRGPRGRKFLYRARYQPEVPYQPRWEASASARLKDVARSSWIHGRARRAGLR